jgi:hypothetical protein
MVVERVKYPEVEYPDDLDIWPHRFYEFDVFVEEKRDGSQASIWYDGERMWVSSRNQKSAIFAPNVMKLQEYRLWKDWLFGLSDPTRYVVFGEYIPHGYGPTKIEGYNEYEQFVVFDIYDRKEGGFLRVEEVAKIADILNVPRVAILGMFFQNPDVIKLIEQDILPRLKKREGVVLKIYHPNKPIMSYVAKMKIPLLKSQSAGRSKQSAGERTDLTLPTIIPDEKIMRAINNCFHAEFNADILLFMDKKTAMPKVAEYVKLECREHGYSMPKGNRIFEFYKMFVRERGNVL